MDVRQTEVASRITISQPFMVDSHEVQDCRVVVVNMAGFVDSRNTVGIRFTVGNASLNATTGQQARKRIGLVLSAP